MLLNEQEIRKVSLNASRESGVTNPSTLSLVKFARAIESAVLEKLKAQEPACFVGRIEDGAMLLMSMPDDWVATPLYEHPLPPDDVVRVAELEAVLRECRGELDRLSTCEQGTQYRRVSSAITKIDEVLNEDR